MKRNRAGSTSQRSGNLPAVFFSTPFNPKSPAPRVLATEELVDSLASQGITFESRDVAEYLLERESMQHVSPYLSLFKDEAGRVNPGTTLSDLHRLILFDKKLQSILMEYIGMFELQLRARYSQLLSSECGAFAHRDPRNFRNRAHFDTFIDIYRREFRNQMAAGNQEILRAFEVYGDAPLWTAVEIMSFGTLSKLYQNTRPKTVKHGVADSFGVKSHQLESWTRSLSFTRNRCAHFGILAGQHMPLPPESIPGIQCCNTSLFYQILILEKLLCNDTILFKMPKACYGFAFAQAIFDLFNAFPDMLCRARIPENWSSLLFRSEITGIEQVQERSVAADGSYWFEIEDDAGSNIVRFDRWGGSCHRIEPRR